MMSWLCIHPCHLITHLSKNELFSRIKYCPFDQLVLPPCFLFHTFIKSWKDTFHIVVVTFDFEGKRTVIKTTISGNFKFLNLV